MRREREHETLGENSKIRGEGREDLEEKDE
jgi:hypothetical protein